MSFLIVGSNIETGRISLREETQSIGTMFTGLAGFVFPTRETKTERGGGGEHRGTPRIIAGKTTSVFRIPGSGKRATGLPKG